MTDCPTRERGQWVGDVVTVGASIAAAAFDDLRVFRKALIDATLSARTDGLVSGLCPGTVMHIPTYAAAWTEGVLTYLDLTGDCELPALLYGSMVRNTDALAGYLGPGGITDRPGAPYPLGWSVIDWGYVPNDGACDMAVAMHVLNSFRFALRWHRLMESSPPFILSEVASAYRPMLPDLKASAEHGDDRLGYHRMVLAMRLGLIPARRASEALAAIRRHQDRCFPNDVTAPRNGTPTKSEPRLITPYFLHYALPLFIENGQFDYALAQYRSCWGWMLGDGESTLCEVFDRRWSHCHQWSGAPTWHLTRYLLGLEPRFSLGLGTYRFSARRSGVIVVHGALPVQGYCVLRITRVEEDDVARLEVTCPLPITIVGRDDSVVRLDAGDAEVIGELGGGRVRR